MFCYDVEQHEESELRPAASTYLSSAHLLIYYIHF